VYLSQKNLSYTVRDIRKDPGALEELVALGVRSTPCIRIGEKILVGFNPKAIDKALADTEGAQPAG
jgi:glutaredoxin